jgi:hypothetical protein
VFGLPRGEFELSLERGEELRYTVRVRLRCLLAWALGCPEGWLDVLVVSVWVSLDEIDI